MRSARGRDRRRHARARAPRAPAPTAATSASVPHHLPDRPRCRRARDDERMRNPRGSGGRSDPAVPRDIRSEPVARSAGCTACGLFRSGLRGAAAQRRRPERERERDGAARARDVEREPARPARRASTRGRGRRTRRSGAARPASASSAPAICSRGTKSPHSSSWGRTKAGMNWTAWNSVEAKALRNRPERHAEHARWRRRGRARARRSPRRRGRGRRRRPRR